jgi:ribonuclease Z
VVANQVLRYHVRCHACGGIEGIRMLKVTLLGTGSPEPRANRHGSAHLVEADGEYLLFDCGPGATQRLAATDVPIVEIDFQFFTHHHYDHNVDFAQFALVRWDQGAGKNSPLQVYGPKGTERYVDQLFGAGGVFEPDIVARMNHPMSIEMYRSRDGECHRQRIALGAKDIQPGLVCSGATWQVSAAPAVHAQPYHDCLSYRVDCDGGSVVITGDTIPCRSTIELARDVDLLLHMAPDKNDWDDPVVARRFGTFGPRNLAEAAAESGAKTLVIVHKMGDRWDDPIESQLILDEIGQTYEGRVILGEDLMEVTPA